MAIQAAIETVIPEELQQRRQWVVWKRDADGTKIPMQPSGKAAKVNDPATWTSFAEAVTVSSGFNGIGYVITAEDPYTGVDLDCCIDADGNLRDWSLPIVARLVDVAYGEISPSGRGVKFLTRAVKPMQSGNVRRFGDDKQQIEVYDGTNRKTGRPGHRWWAMTGDVYAGSDTIGDGQESVTWICSTYLMPAAGTHQTRSDARKPTGGKMSVVDRAKAYVAKMEASVSGQRGHDRCFAAACAAVIGFDLDPDQAMDVLVESFNPRCEPAWSSDELRHKIECAAALPDERGKLRDKPLAGGGSRQAGKDDRRPAVKIDLDYGRCVDEVVACVARLGFDSPWIPEGRREAVKIYRRGGVLVEVVEETRPDATTKDGRVRIPRGAVRVRDLPAQQVPIRIAEACRTFVEQKTKVGIVDVDVPPPHWLVGAVYTSASCRVRPLDGIVTAPTIRADGSVLQSPGWDAATGLVYRPSMDFGVIPDQPTQRDAAEAVTRLIELVADFPFAADADRSGWLAMLLSLIGRPCVAGQVPLFAITANTRGSGKSMLIDVASIISYGHVASRTPYCSDDREMRKQITSVAIEAAPVVMLDNVEGSIGGSSLDAVLTSGRWKDRVLGLSRTFEGEIRTVWTTTGNNLSFRSDIARRVLPIRLHSPLEHPEERTDFVHASLLEHVHRHRAELVRSALTLLRAYFVAGCPAIPGGTFGSFESWSEVIRGAVVWSGMADPLATRETATADDESFAIVRGLIGGLLEMDDTGEGLTAAEIVERLRKSKDDEPDPFPIMRGVVGEMIAKPDPKKLGYELRKYRHRVAGGCKIDTSPNRRNTTQWRVVQTTSDDGDAGDAKTASPSSSPAGFTRQNTVFSHNDGDDGDAFAQRGDDLFCPQKTPFTAAHKSGPTRDNAKASPSSPSSPSSYRGVCPECGGATIPSGIEVSGWMNWDCEGCGKVVPVQLEGAA